MDYPSSQWDNPSNCNQNLCQLIKSYKNDVSNIGKVGDFMLVFERFDLYKDC